MRRRTSYILLSLTLLAIVATVFTLRHIHLKPQDAWQKHTSDFFELFNTHTTITVYAQTKEEANRYTQIIYDEMLRLHKLFDIYNTYENINNLATINANAGGPSIHVDKDIIGLILFAQDAYEETNATVNIALGPVLFLWHEAREQALSGHIPTLPTEEQLQKAKSLSDINGLEINPADSTMRLAKEGIRLDVGAIAKGYATQQSVELAKKAGLQSAMINSGGNVITVGAPKDGRDNWSVGISSPEKEPDGTQKIIDLAYVHDASAVSSGNYQRYFTLGGKNYHHIIDPSTCFPAHQFAAVTIIHPDAAIADMLSTAAFIMPLEQAQKLLQKYDAKALWIQNDGKIVATKGYSSISKLAGFKR